MNVLLSIAVLGLLIFFHESGHFLAAVLQKIKVSGFSIGFGPALLKKEINGITYSLRSLPLGGFVSFLLETSINFEISNLSLKEKWFLEPSRFSNHAPIPTIPNHNSFFSGIKTIPIFGFFLYAKAI